MVGVADTGEGIPSNKHGKLFQRFQQVDDNSKTQEVKGQDSACPYATNWLRCMVVVFG